ncbi:MAG TPA: amidase [Anaerolineae bacterium]|nr:amidase [Anaerolineae bacterium]
MNELNFFTASQLASMVRERKISAVEVMEAQLKHIAQYNPTLNAIVTLDAERALQRARVADEALARGETWGTLHGVPVTIKDCFETADLRTTSGYPPFADYVPQRDGAAVALLRQAGAIILGKTNLPPLAAGGQSVSPIFGRTNNPWNLDRTPGGSSGGGAAAVAAGLSPLDLGSDISGSLRMPAHFCGIYSLKPTGCRIPLQGHRSSVKPLKVPTGWEVLYQLPVAGPLARSIDDLRLSLSVLADPKSPALRPTPTRSIHELHIAWTDEMDTLPLGDEVRAALQTLADRLARSGAHVERQPSPGVPYAEAWQASAAALAAMNTLFQSTTTRLMRKATALIPESRLPHDPIQHGFMYGASLQAKRMQHIFEQRQSLIQRVDEFMTQWDAWLCPVFSIPAFTHRALGDPIEVGDRSLSADLAEVMPNVIFNFTGHPVVVVPIGRSSDGLPIGVQIAGKRWGEMELLAVAEQIAQVTGGYQRPPGY